MSRGYLEKAYDVIDAAVFSGDMLFDDVDRGELKVYIERWGRAIDVHEKIEEEEMK